MHFILFCRVIDRFGDAAVAWRLGRQLIAAGQRCTLLIDHLPTLQQLCPELDPQQPEFGGIQLLIWSKDLRPADLPHAQVWIECFGCGWGIFANHPPPGSNPPLRYNLEYLGTEPWVDHCHGLASPDPRTGLKTTFWIPGFSIHSGGLLRENPLITTDTSDILNTLFPEPVNPDACTVSLFCYLHAPLHGLAMALMEQSLQQETHLLLFPGEPTQAWSQLSLPVSRLQVHHLPWLSHTDYDRLLHCCSLNIVRGEDSFVRAHWAGRPLLWHAYPQDDLAHLDKVSGWLAQRPVSQAFHHWHLRFNQGRADQSDALSALNALSEEQKTLLDFRHTLLCLPSLMEQLLEHIRQQSPPEQTATIPSGPCHKKTLEQ